MVVISINPMSKNDEIGDLNAPKWRPNWRDLVTRGMFPATLIGGVALALGLMRSGMAPEKAAMAIALGVLALVAVVERVLPFDRSANQGTGDTQADLWSLAIVAGGLESLIGAAAPLVAAAAYAALAAQGLTGTGFPSHWPVLLQAVLLVLLADLAKYWFHRFGHEHPLGWRLHSVHHASKRVYWLNGFRIHPLYHLINFLLAVLPWLCLGASVEAVALHTVILAISAAFQHANIELRNGWLNKVFNTNELHRWHHSRRIDEANANYGAVLVVWDLLFGTYRARTPGQPIEMGLENEAGYPMNSYFKQLLIPFQSRWWREQEQRVVHK